MSDANQEARGWHLYVRDMIGFSEKVLFYTSGLDQSAFVADDRTYDATLRNLELVGEAATHIPEAVRDTHPEIAWRQIIAMRNRVAHGYLGIDEDVIWDVIQNDIPNLLPALRNLLSFAEEAHG
jgi:uncharacterized protein with HEPN domain